MSTSLGLSPDLLYAIDAAVFAAEIVVFDASLKLAPIECCPIPFIQTGISANFFALFSDTNNTADAPLQMREQSNSLRGSTTFFESITSLTVTRFEKSEFGFFFAFRLLFTQTLASCSSVVPYFRICDLANIAAQYTGKVNAPLDISQSSLRPGVTESSAPTINTHSQRPDLM